MSAGSEKTKPINQHPVTYQGTVYPWHCDHMEHMNVMWYVGKFDEATWHFFATVGITAEYLRTQGLGMAAVDQHLRYMAELVAGDLVIVRSHWLEVKEKSLSFCHNMYNAQTGNLAATCKLTAVHTNSKTRKFQAFDTAIFERAEAAVAKQ